MEIIEDAKPIPEDQWKGASGMPVFVGSQILGIVKHIPPHYDHKKLQAVPTWRLLDCKSFKRALGVLSDELERLERGRQLLTDLLKGSEDVTRDLAYDFDSQVPCHDMKKCRNQVVERLLTETPPRSPPPSDREWR